MVCGWALTEGLCESRLPNAGSQRKGSASLHNPRSWIEGKSEVFVHDLIPIRMCPDAQIFDLSPVAKRPPTGTQLPAGRRAVLASLQISANLF